MRRSRVGSARVDDFPDSPRVFNTVPAAKVSGHLLLARQPIANLTERRAGKGCNQRGSGSRTIPSSSHAKSPVSTRCAVR